VGDVDVIVTHLILVVVVKIHDDDDDDDDFMMRLTRIDGLVSQ
jgi:hypothetical protein